MENFLCMYNPYMRAINYLLSNNGKLIDTIDLDFKIFGQRQLNSKSMLTRKALLYSSSNTDLMKYFIKDFSIIEGEYNANSI